MGCRTGNGIFTESCACWPAGRAGITGAGGVKSGVTPCAKAKKVPVAVSRMPARSRIMADMSRRFLRAFCFLKLTIYLDSPRIESGTCFLHHAQRFLDGYLNLDGRVGIENPLQHFL